jgi:hypothetical protein
MKKGNAIIEFVKFSLKRKNKVRPIILFSGLALLDMVCVVSLILNNYDVKYLFGLLGLNIFFILIAF